VFLMREVPLYTPSSPKTRTPPRASGIESSFSSLLLSNLELSDTNVYAPQIRALLGTGIELRRNVSSWAPQFLSSHSALLIAFFFFFFIALTPRVE